ncbi:MAG: DUF4864 domain-containing protein [Actinomycetota bacterium]|nr:DUF4864 domain-containing protein [Actinomycetota bacterium]MDG2120871.1 DUF4864 domain-containing protein [Actinomycetota bacterium]
MSVLMLLGCASETAKVMSEQSLVNPELNNGCPQRTRSDIEDRILAQIEALGRRSFDEALDHASLAFRKSIDTRSFEAMIRSGFPILLDNATVSFGRCQEFGDMAMIEVSFRDQPSAGLIYSLGLADSQWWIEAAAPLSDIFPGQEELKEL